jgi:hypothetical protein
MESPVHVPVVWRSAILPRGYEPRGPLVEVHLVPVGEVTPYEAHQLEQVRDELAGSGSSRVGSSPELAWAFSADGPAGECGLAVLRAGQRTCWFPLPGTTALAREVAGRLTSLLAIGLPAPGHFAPGIGLDPITATTKSSETFRLTSPGRIRIGPEDVFSVEDLRRGPEKVADDLVARLVAPLER